MKRILSGAFILVSTLSALVTAQSESEPVERSLVDSEGYVTESGDQTRCGDYFVLETKKYGDFEVSEVHVVFELGDGIATSILYSNDFDVVVDESKSTPVLLMKRENPSLEKDTVKLSTAAYEEAKECLPPLGDGETDMGR